MHDTYTRPGERRVVRINATWDPEASVYVAASDDLPGLVTESPSLDELLAKLPAMIQDLLKDGEQRDDSEIPFELLTRSATARRARH